MPSSVRPCHLLPIFTARGWIFTDEWSQQQHQYFQWLSKTYSKTCWRLNWPIRSEEAVRSGELYRKWNYGILLRYLQSLTFPFKFESNHLEGKAWECRQQPVLKNVQKRKSCQRLCQKSCLWANQRDFLVMWLWIFGDGKKVVTIHWPCPSPPWWFLFWLAGKPLHRRSAEKHGWPVGTLALARLRETQNIFTRVVVWSYFFMIWERIQCWIRKNLHMGAKKIYQRFFVSPLHWILPWLEHKKKLNHLTNSCEGIGSDVSN